jgi:antitoxin (DNA-binding transcriptional repressor) of toxin-antitoxin stability system
MKTATISTKEIRNDLEGFLKRIRNGQTIQVMYRSKPLVTVTAAQQNDGLPAPDAGTPAAAKRAIEAAKRLSNRPTTLDPNKSFKQLYEETQVLPDDYA